MLRLKTISNNQTVSNFNLNFLFFTNKSQYLYFYIKQKKYNKYI